MNLEISEWSRFRNLNFFKALIKQAKLFLVQVLVGLIFSCISNSSVFSLVSFQRSGWLIHTDQNKEFVSLTSWQTLLYLYSNYIPLVGPIFLLWLFFVTEDFDGALGVFTEMAYLAQESGGKLPCSEQIQILKFSLISFNNECSVI